MTDNISPEPSDAQPAAAVPSDVAAEPVQPASVAPLSESAAPVFISHSSADAAAARQITAALEAAGVPCWIAPRNIPAGAEYNSAIMEALNRCSALLLVYSRRAAGSDPVLREVERAMNRSVTVVPVRVELAPASKGLEFLISTRQWIDAFPPPLDRHLATIVAEVKRSLSLAHERPPVDPNKVPDYIGPYRVLGLLGEGGMGAVYKAEQRSPVKRTVALKLIKAGSDTKEVIARFEAERQALARMDHAHVAKVLEAGADERGRPYFVMEYVPGVPITQFADEQKLTVRQRLALFTQVCDAITHAHTKGLIHRDIKPSNVLACLIDGKPTVKVIDFGIAKALTGDKLTDRTLTIGTGAVIGTYASMSPEQAAGSADIDTRTDVYSLGVLIYELLTGATPFDEETLARAADEEKRRVIRDVEPPKPSTRISTLGAKGDAVAAARQQKLDALARELRSELEWIPLKALRKERDRRYQSSAELAEDVANYLAGRPLLAAPESRAYLARKWVRRNRTGLATATAFVVLLVISIGTYIQGIRAEQAKTAAALAEAKTQRAEALRQQTDAEKQRGIAVGARNDALDANQRLSETITKLKQVNIDLVAARDEAQRQGELALQTLSSLIGDIQNQLADVPGLRELRVKLLDDALKGLEKISESLAADFRVSGNKSIAHYKLGCLFLTLGESGGRGGVTAAKREFERARDFWRQIDVSEPEFKDISQGVVASLYNKLGEVSVLEGDVVAAKKYFLEAASILQAVIKSDPKNTQMQRELSISYQNLGEVSQREGNMPAARKFLEQGIQVRQQLADADPKHVQTQRELLMSFNSLGHMSLREGDLVVARKLFEQELEISRQLTEADAKDAKAQLDLAMSYNALGELSLKEDDLKAARKFFEQDLEISQRLFDADPTNTRTQRDLAATCKRLGEVLLKEGNQTVARKLFEQALEISRRLAEADLKNVESQRSLSVAYDKLGVISQAEGDLNGARRYFEQALEISRRPAEADLNNFSAQRDLSVLYGRLGTVNQAEGNLALAVKSFEQSQKINQRLADSDPKNAGAQRDLSISAINLGEANLLEGKVAAAKKLFEQDVEINSSLAKENPKDIPAQLDLLHSYTRLGNACLKEGNFAASRESLEKGLALIKRLADSNPKHTKVKKELSLTYQWLGEVSVAEQDQRRAREFYEQGLEIVNRVASDDPTDIDALRHQTSIYTRLGNISKRARDLPAAKGFFEQALESSLRLTAAQPKDAQAQLGLQVSYAGLGEVCQQQGDIAAAKKYSEQSLEIMQRLVDAEPWNAENRRRLATLCLTLGSLNQKEGDLWVAKKFFERSLEFAKRSADENQEDAQAQRELAIVYRWLGDVSTAEKKSKVAKSYFEQALEIDRRLVEAEPGNAVDLSALALSYNKLGMLDFLKGDLAPAKKYFEQGVKIRRQLVEAEPMNLDICRELAIACYNLGGVNLQEGDLAAAKKFYQQYLEILRDLAEANAKGAEMPREVLTAYDTVGILCIRTCDVEAARTCFEPAFQMKERFALADSKSASLEFELATGYLNLATTDRHRFEFVAGTERLRQASKIVQRLVLKVGVADALNVFHKSVRSGLRDCELGPVAIGKLEELLAQPDDKRSELLALRCRLFAGRGEVAAAIEAAEELGKLRPATAEESYQAAAAYAQLAIASLYGKIGDEAQREPNRHKYSELTLAALTKAIDAGFDDVARLDDAGSSFWLFSSNSEFKALLARAAKAAGK